MFSKLKVILLTGFFLFIATNVAAAPYWTFHTGHQIKYTRAKADGTNWLVTMTIGAGGQNQCSRSDYYKVDEYNYDNDSATKTMYLRVTENEGYQCEGGTTEIKFFQTGPEGTGWSYGTDTDGVRFQVVAATNFGARYVIRRYEIEGGVNKPAVFNTFMRGFGLMKETDNWVSDNAPWTQLRHGYGGRTLYANFTGYGLYVYDYDGKGTWTQINGNVAANMVAGGPLLYATFEGYGLYVWDGSTWTQINGNIPANMVTGGANLYATFTGYGLYLWDGSTWTQINGNIPTSMVFSGSYLYCTFAGYGLYKYDGTAWTQINGNVPAKIVEGLK
ncbi:MAG TPA: hypothetical protein PLX02_13450 [Syntrophorhabdaceae bacterium]|nr:hypothetical protein [Syntrophorhabdaceae bacterium]